MIGSSVYGDYWTDLDVGKASYLFGMTAGRIWPHKASSWVSGFEFYVNDMKYTPQLYYGFNQIPIGSYNKGSLLIEGDYDYSISLDGLQGYYLTKGKALLLIRLGLTADDVTTKVKQVLDTNHELDSKYEDVDKHNTYVPAINAGLSLDVPVSKRSHF